MSELPQPQRIAGSSEVPSFGTQAVEYVDALFAAALRLTRDAHAAQDLVQDTYVKALRFGHRFEPGTNLRGWLFTILHNTFRNDRRGVVRSPIDVDSEVVEQAAADADTAVTPESALIRAATVAEVRDALQRLPDVYRQAVWLRDVEEFSYAAIAGMLDVPIGTVMSRIARGRRLLQQGLGATLAGRARRGRG